MNILSYTFFQHAIWGCLLAGILCGLIGTYIVTRRLVFISGGITHASFGGIGIGVYLGMSPIVAAAIFSVLSACGIRWFSRKGDMREDSAIAVFWTLGMSIGIIFSFLTPGFTPELSSYLFGNLLTVTTDNLMMLTILTAMTVTLFTLFLRPLVSIAFDRTFARSQQLPVAFFEYLMMTFIALTIVACLRMVGIVLVISLLTIPQVTANLFTHRFSTMAILSVIVGWAGCLGGLYFSYRYNIPSGAAIIFVSVLIYALCKIGSMLFMRRKDNNTSGF